MAKIYLDKGDRLQNDQQFVEAIEAYQVALEIDPTLHKAYHALGNVHVKNQEFDQAIASYQKAIEIAPTAASSYFRLGELLLQQEKIEDSIEQLQKCVDLDCLHPTAYLRLAEAWTKLQNWHEVALAYQKAIEVDPGNYPIYLKLKTAAAIANGFQEVKYPERSSDRFSRLQQVRSRTFISILFILPVRGGSGGAHSVTQECLTMHRCGVKAHIAVNEANYSSFLKSYPDIPEIKELVISYKTLTDLKVITKQFSVVCATIYNSVSILEQLVQNDCDFLPAYYIQDYEPLFTNPASWEWRLAMSSYTCIPGMVLFAKTHWLCNVISKNHNVQVHKVEPSIDHDVYYPDLNRPCSDVQVAAMVRFKTPRRGPHRTLRVIQRLAELLPDTAKFTVFGSNPKQFPKMPKNVVVKGELTRTGVADILRSADLFLDLSDYQAFGRTALEGMACGCIPIVPNKGGTNEFAISRFNAWVVDTCSEDMIVDSVTECFQMSAHERTTMRLNALSTAAQYSLKKSALSMLTILQNSYTNRINNCNSQAF